MTESILKLEDGAQLHLYSSPVNQPRAHLLFVHGYAEHAGRYHDFASILNKREISFSSFDQRGFGQSDGLKAYVRRFDDLVQNLEQVISFISTDRPLILMGHSMGGLVVTKYMIEKKDERVQGIISSSGALELDPNLSPLLQRLAPVLGFLFPKLPTEPLDKTYLTRNPENLEQYMNDPLIYLKGTRARTGAELIKTIKQISNRFAELNVPLLVLHGGADRLTMPGGSQRLYDEAASADKQIKLYPGLYHELIFEPERDEIIEDICNWILDHSFQYQKSSG